MLTAVRPPGELARDVAAIWLHDGATAPTAERLLPTGTVELIFELRWTDLEVYDEHDQPGARSRAGALVSGPQRRPFVIHPRPGECVLGVHFRPGGAWRLLGVHQQELRDRHVPLEDLIGWHNADALRTRLNETADLRARAAIVARWLEAEAARHVASAHDAVRYSVSAIEQQPATRVRSLLEETTLSSRRLNDLFRRELGLTPKLFSRIQRFQRVLDAVQVSMEPASDTQSVDWADLAFCLGYSDQAHLSREFKELSGVTPSTYLALAPANPNHLPHDACSELATNG